MRRLFHPQLFDVLFGEIQELFDTLKFREIFSVLEQFHFPKPLVDGFVFLGGLVGDGIFAS